MAYDKELTADNCHIRFDPMESITVPALKECFGNPKARALWLAYRCWHIADQYVAEYLPQNCLNIARLCEKMIMAEAIRTWEDEVLARWLAPRLLLGCGSNYQLGFMKGDGIDWSAKVMERLKDPINAQPVDIIEPDGIQYARYVRPYLTGEKIAEYKIIKDEDDGRT